MSKRVVALEGRLAFEMLPRSLRGTVELEKWQLLLGTCLPAITAWMQDADQAEKVLSGLAVMLAYTKQVEVIATHEPSLLAFKGWLEEQPADRAAWVMQYTEIPEVITDAWGEAFVEGLKVFEITPERKPFDLLTPAEVEAATDPKVSSSKSAGAGSKSRSPKRKKEFPVATRPS